MTKPLRDARILMYSHDTFGLGHLRRCRAIAHSLVEDYRGLNVLIISGATIAGAFDYRARVDFVKIPSVIKLRNGEYTSMAEHVDLQDTLKMRRSIIRHTAETFRPDIFIVDKEPMGLHGEVEDTLTWLRTQGTRLVLGLREVMDSPALLAAEWAKVGMIDKINRHFDNIWVYGPRDFHDPLTGFVVPQSLRDKMDYVGFLPRQTSRSEGPLPATPPKYLLVTPGGGGDGAALVEAVIAAYRADPGIALPAFIVLGPYMPADQRQRLAESARQLPQVSMIEFNNHMESLVSGAEAVVCMGGYNTWCEILSFDKPALMVPRIAPREEQLIRARRASELGLASMLMPDEAADPQRMAAALRRLVNASPPSASGRNPALDGLENISRIVGGWLDTGRSVTAARAG